MFHGSGAQERLNKRRRGGSNAVIADPNGGGAIVTTSSDRTGKRLGRTEMLMKMLAAGITKRVDRFCFLSPTSNDAGAFPLSYWNITGGTVLKTFPLYMMDLTCINQSVNGILGNALPCPMMRLRKDIAGAGQAEVYRFVAIPGRNAQVVDGPMWTYQTVEGRAIGPIQDSGIKKALIGHIDIGMVITGATRFASDVIVSLIQFTDENYSPPLLTTNLPTNPSPPIVVQEDLVPSHVLDEKEHDDFYTNLVDHLVINPLNDKNYRNQGPKFKTLYTKKFKFNPTMTVESNADGHDAVFKLRYNMNKVVSYDLSPYSTNDVENNALDNPNLEQETATVETLYPNCHKKGRVYLMIRGTAPRIVEEEALGTALTENFCSFDLKVHRTMYKLRAENMS